MNFPNLGNGLKFVGMMAWRLCGPIIHLDVGGSCGHLLKHQLQWVIEPDRRGHGGNPIIKFVQLLTTAGALLLSCVSGRRGKPWYLCALMISDEGERGEWKSWLKTQHSGEFEYCGGPRTRLRRGRLSEVLPGVKKKTKENKTKKKTSTFIKWRSWHLVPSLHGK